MFHYYKVFSIESNYAILARTAKNKLDISYCSLDEDNF